MNTVNDEILEHLQRQLTNPRVSVRRKAVNRISVKKGGKVIQAIADERVIPVLRSALNDKDLIVRRAAARGLRSFVKRSPDLLNEVLPEYAQNTFDGTYTHLGLYDVRANVVWVPRFAALSGHAALLEDGNADQCFKFEFFIPGQVPHRIQRESPDRGIGHLVLHFIPDWDYSRQVLIPEFDERRREVNMWRQEEYALKI